MSDSDSQVQATAQTGDSVDCVLDASVGIKLFLVEPLSAQADGLFAHLAPHRRPVSARQTFSSSNAPTSSGSTRGVFGHSPRASLQDVADLTRLPLRVTPTADLVEAALSLALNHAITAYDAAYVALARRLTLPLVTADDTLVRRLQGSGLDVRSLADWPERTTHASTA